MSNFVYLTGSAPASGIVSEIGNLVANTTYSGGEDTAWQVVRNDEGGAYWSWATSYQTLNGVAVYSGSTYPVFQAPSDPTYGKSFSTINSSNVPSTEIVTVASGLLIDSDVTNDTGNAGSYGGYLYSMHMPIIGYDPSTGELQTGYHTASGDVLGYYGNIDYTSVLEMPYLGSGTTAYVASGHTSDILIPAGLAGKQFTTDGQSFVFEVAQSGAFNNYVIDTSVNYFPLFNNAKIMYDLFNTGNVSIDVPRYTRSILYDVWESGVTSGWYGSPVDANLTANYSTINESYEVYHGTLIYQPPTTTLEGNFTPVSGGETETYYLRLQQPLINQNSDITFVSENPSQLPPDAQSYALSPTDYDYQYILAEYGTGYAYTPQSGGLSVFDNPWTVTDATQSAAVETWDQVSPPALCFYANNSLDSLGNMMRRQGNWVVKYYLSIKDNRIALVLQGDPSPDYANSYTNFLYFGAITPLSNEDTEFNVAFTGGLGLLSTNQTGLAPTTIEPQVNPVYSANGLNGSNGMDSISMFTQFGTPFQKYYPSFLSQLQSIDVDIDYFQQSAWTGKYHGSPVYIVHMYEGYRGYLDDVVAVDNVHILQGDLLVENCPDSGEDKTYTFFDINTATNFLNNLSPNTNMGIAIRTA